MKKTLFLTLIFVSFNVFSYVQDKLPNGDLAYYPKDFYANMKAGHVTIDQLFNILSTSHSTVKGDYDVVGRCLTNCYAHKSIGYDQARVVMFDERDVLTDGKEKYIKDVYCGKKYSFKDGNSTDHTEVNIEHTWPQSKFSTKYDKGMQKSDMHHLYLTDSKANSDRGNNEFGIAGDAKNEIHAQDCDISVLFRGDSGYLFQPPANHRGNVARSLFYFAVRYNMPISKKQEAALRQWHVADPVDAMEIARHEIVAKHQNIRNPFVDFPKLVDQISDF